MTNFEDDSDYEDIYGIEEHDSDRLDREEMDEWRTVVALESRIEALEIGDTVEDDERVYAMKRADGRYAVWVPGQVRSIEPAFQTARAAAEALAGAV